MNLWIIGTNVSFHFSPDGSGFARSRTIPQESGIGSVEDGPERARGMDAPSQIKGLRGGVHLVRRTSDPVD